LSHAAAKSFNARWRPDLVEETKPDHLRTTNDWSCNFQS